MANITKLTPEKEQQFLAALSSGASVAKAAQSVGVTRQTAYEHRKNDEVFAADWASAVDAGTDALEDEAVRRARDGVSKPVFYKGEECGYVQEYSDTLLIFMLKARRPEKFRESVSVEATGPGGGPIQLMHSVPRPEDADRT